MSKFRMDFVTNSSSSSFICEICGRNESGWDIGLSECGMVECENGHTFCEDEIIDLNKEQLIKMILEYEYNEDTTEDDIKDLNEEDLLSNYFDFDDARYQIPECLCPICQFIEYSDYDLSRYLEKKYDISRETVFEEVKKINKRRKKLYENEYITHVCKEFNLNPTEIVAQLKQEFGTYSKFKQYLK